MPEWAWRTFIKREITLSMRHLADLISPWIFFLIMITLFPLSMPPNSALMQQLVPGIIWVGALLATLLIGERFFRADFNSGVLLQWCVCGQPLSLMILIKVMLAWFYSIFVLISLMPILMFVFTLSWLQVKILSLGLLLGTPSLFFMNALATSLTLNISKNAVLLAMMVLPLCIPLIVFGAGAVVLCEQGVSPAAPLSLIAAMSLLCVTFLPSAIAAAVRSQLV